MIRSLPYRQKTVSRHDLENELRAWHLRKCQEHSDSETDKQSYFRERREDRRWFRALRDNQDFQRVISAFSRESNPVSRSISLVSWMKAAQKSVDNQSIPYKQSGRVSQLDKVNGGLRERFFPELDKRLPDVLIRRSGTIAGLSDFLGLPTDSREVVSTLRRHLRASVAPTKPRGAIEITELLQAWRAPKP